MKKIVLVPLILLVVFASCKKDDLATPGLAVGTINASVDNLPVSFNFSNMADTAFHSGDAHILVIQGWQGTEAASNYISFSIVNPGGPIAPGSYLASSFYYWDQSDSTAYVFSETAPPQVIITAITDSTISGTFSSNVYNNFGVDYTSTHDITNGKFNVQFQSVKL